MSVIAVENSQTFFFSTLGLCNLCRQLLVREPSASSSKSVDVSKWYSSTQCLKDYIDELVVRQGLDDQC